MEGLQNNDRLLSRSGPRLDLDNRCHKSEGARLRYHSRPELRDMGRNEGSCRDEGPPVVGRSERDFMRERQTGRGGTLSVTSLFPVRSLLGSVRHSTVGSLFKVCPPLLPFFLPFFRHRSRLTAPTPSDSPLSHPDGHPSPLKYHTLSRGSRPSSPEVYRPPSQDRSSQRLN